MSRITRRRKADLFGDTDLIETDVDFDEVDAFDEIDEFDEEIPSDFDADLLEDEEEIFADDDEVILDETIEDDDEAILAEDDDDDVEDEGDVDDDDDDDEEDVEVTARRRYMKRRLARRKRRASEVADGIEDEIQDTAGGGDPTTSLVSDGGEKAKAEVSTDAEVFPTDGDKVTANYKKMKRLASQLLKAGHRKQAVRVNKLASVYLKSNRGRKAESQEDGLFPGDVGNMERSKNYRDIDQYHKFEPTLNHWTPDMRHEWKENPRTETGHGIPKVASLYQAAQNSIKLALMLLGDDASEEDVERQARDFMKLGNTRLVASINRWMKAEEDEADEETEDAVAEEVETEEVETVEVETEEVETEEVETKEEVETVEADDENCEADDDELEVETDEVVDEGDVDFDVAEENEVEADAELEGIFADEEIEEDDEKPVVAKRSAKKQGLKKIGGQPKIARTASSKINDLEALWSKLDSPSL